MRNLDRGHHIMNSEVIVVNSSTDIHDIDMSNKAVVFSGGTHDIKGKVIGGQLLVCNGALVCGEGVTINNTSRKSVPLHMIEPILTKRSWLSRLLRIRNIERDLEVRSPIIVMSGSTLKIQSSKVFTGYKFEDAYLSVVAQRSFLDASFANFKHL